MCSVSFSWSNDSLDIPLGSIKTIFCFFGLILVYGLTSLDNRFERFEKVWERLPEKSYSNEKREDVNVWYMAVMNLNNWKKDFINNSLITGSFLVVSFIFAILALGVTNTAWISYISSISVGILFVCLFRIFWVVYNLKKDPAQNPKNTA